MDTAGDGRKVVKGMKVVTSSEEGRKREKGGEGTRCAGKE